MKNLNFRHFFGCQTYVDCCICFAVHEAVPALPAFKLLLLRLLLRLLLLRHGTCTLAVQVWKIISDIKSTVKLDPCEYKELGSLRN